MNLKEFKPALWLIAKFFIAYIVLTLLYSQYLQHFSELKQLADPFTAWVADSTAQVMQWLGFNADSEQVSGETFRRFLLNDRYICIINEGCNAIAIMIIFVSFIIAFSKRFLPSFLYSVGGRDFTAPYQYHSHCNPQLYFCLPRRIRRIGTRLSVPCHYLWYGGYFVDYLDCVFCAKK